MFWYFINNEPFFRKGGNEMTNKRKNANSRELGLYIVVGIATIAVNIGILVGLSLLGVNYLVANLIAILSSKVFGYIGNKKIVFKSRCETSSALFKEIGSFVITRGFTGIVDYMGLILAVQLLGANLIAAKCFISILVIVINYITGKFMVFKKKKLPSITLEHQEEKAIV